ncbi:MAG TPA: hypothetical protein VH353_11190 [Caulobacteraceae bacterium]|jgi:hypothetical protein|nr:hypothetical protein [Caulobacteraceae bacterium]
MGALKYAKHEVFARGVADGKDVMEAYAGAGYAPPHRQMALRMARDGKISARVEALRNEAAWGGSRDLSVVINALMKLGSEGEATTAAMVAAKRSCLVEAAKLKAQLPVPQPVFQPLRQLSKEEWAAKYGR